MSTCTPPRFGRLGLLALGSALLTTALLPGLATEAGAGEQPCADGSFCAFPQAEFGGTPEALPSRSTEIEKCVALETGWEVRSFINRAGRPVTTYQDPNCSTHAEFDTHPDGSQTPRASYVVRAIKIWER
ncbi:peptidase inhibitor family I36 protein [Saccharopolyspora griseoalba]|uniref:Peptidase inhibitor family I36 protein n=1 Tax=Saccharopolyspora griseoalba TaxID=1431848 RepID=A0ABW2LIE6_9PSEU